MATVGRRRVGPGQIITSDWGNTVWDQSVQSFDSAADRNGQFAEPQEGALAWLNDSKMLTVFRDGDWRNATAGRGAFRVGLTASVETPVPSDTYTTPPWDTKIDPDGVIDSNYRFVAPVDGLMYFAGCINYGLAIPSQVNPSINAFSTVARFSAPAGEFMRGQQFYMAAYGHVGGSVFSSPCAGALPVRKGEVYQFQLYFNATGAPKVLSGGIGTYFSGFYVN